MSYHEPTGVIIAPLSQSCMDFTAREVDLSGKGGGSPRVAPAQLAPDIRIPQSGQELYVFALP